METSSLQATDNFLSPGKIVRVAAFSVAYLLLSYFLIGFKRDQVYLVLLFNGCYFFSAITRKLITGFLIFIVFWIIFDYMKAFPNYQYGQVHIEPLYNLEKRIFGIAGEQGHILTPNEYWLQHSRTFLDIITGFFYLCWVPVPLIFAGFLFFKNRISFLHFSLTFLLVNIIGFIIYYAYPATPPWYVQQHGFELIPNTPGNTAGLARFDNFFGTDIFKSVYGKSSNVFAAMPSLHSAYPVILLYYGIKNKLGKINILFAFVMVGIWFSAVYTSHHYILDVIAGILCSITGIVLFQWMIIKNKRFKRWVQKFADLIT
jgi:membrane-associated phospholipid phosphatase